MSENPIPVAFPVVCNLQRVLKTINTVETAPLTRILERGILQNVDDPKPVPIHYNVVVGIGQALAGIGTPEALTLLRILERTVARQTSDSFATNLCHGGCGKRWRDCAYYHVHNDVWHAAGLQPKDFVCLACLSTSLGRKLTAADFSDAPVNRPILDVIQNVER